ncbi:MAG: diguanylate cyclase [Chloroflexota bacterium]
MVNERKRADDLAILHAMALAATQASDENELLVRATHLIGERLHPFVFDILLLDEARGELYVHSSFQANQVIEDLRIPLGVGVTGMVAKSGKPKRLNDINQSHNYISGNRLTRSELCLPLKVGENVIGVLNLESTETGAFTPQDEALFEIVAGQLATSIQRLRTAKDERQQTRRLERANAMIKALAQVGSRAVAALDPSSMMETLGKELTNLAMNCIVALADDASENVYIRYTSLPPQTMRLVEKISRQKVQDHPIPLGQVSFGDDKPQYPFLLNDPKVLAKSLIADVSLTSLTKILDIIGVKGNVSVCHLPLMTEGKLIGILWMWGEGLKESDLPTLSLFSSQVAIALQNAKLLAEVRRLAITDELTGIYNRRHLFELADRIFDEAVRYRHPLSVLVLDIDHFKNLNDRFGHLIGDQVLREVAALLQKSLRSSDILGRYGGEEFAIILPSTTKEAAVQVAERIRLDVAQGEIHTDAGTISVCVSVGVSMLSKDLPTLTALIHRADQAMYIAKGAGRNCVAVK